VEIDLGIIPHIEHKPGRVTYVAFDPLRTLDIPATTPAMTDCAKYLVALSTALALAGCNAASSQTCISSPSGFVKLKRDSPSALDGYIYRLCTAPPGSRRCTSYNELVVERPSLLSVELKDGIVRVEQFGGSVSGYTTDPAGMRDPAFRMAVPIEFAFHSDALPARRGVILIVDGKPVSGNSCPE
jgi:hypothetical protein